MSLKNRNVLITGVSGFLGSNLSKELSNIGANVFGVSRSEAVNNTYSLNLLRIEDLDRFIINNKIDICFHLAGESLVERGQLNPHKVLSENYQSSLNILEVSRKNNLDRLIIASSAHVYGDNKVPFFESYYPRPSRPYETSKACIDLTAQSYADSYNLNVLIPRFENIYGPGDFNLTRLIPKTIKSIISGNDPEMWGGGTKRQYLYIDDAVNAYISLANFSKAKIQKNRIFNFGGSELATTEEIIKKIIIISNKNLSIKKVKNKRESEIKSQYVSIDKASKMLDWKPEVNLDEGLNKTYEWALKEFI